MTVQPCIELILILKKVAVNIFNIAQEDTSFILE